MISEALYFFAPLLVFGACERAWGYRPDPAPRPARLARYGRNVFLASCILALDCPLSARIFQILHRLGSKGFGLLPLLRVGFWGNVALTVLAVDLATFLFHRHFHLSPFFWRIHRVHHTDSRMDVTTGFRFHVLEHALFLPVRTAVMMILGSTWISAAVAGVALIVLTYFQHCNFRLPERLERALRLVLTTPDMHRIHHSILSRETDSNYGIIFSFWDRLLGSYRELDDQDRILIGLPDYPEPDRMTIRDLLALPFRVSSAGRPGRLPPAPGSGRGSRALA